MRWTLRLMAALAGLAMLVALALAFVVLLPSERLARLVADRLGDALGREVTIEGAVTTTLWPGLVLEAGGFSVAGPGWAGPEPLVAADRVRLEVTWGGLFEGDLRLRVLELGGARIVLVRDVDGRISWSHAAEGGRSGWPPLDRVALERIAIEGGSLRLDDRMRNRTWTFGDLAAVIGLPEADGAASLAATARLGGRLLEASATAADIAALLAGEARPVRGDLVWPEGTLRFDGMAGTGLGLEGRIAAVARDPGALARDLGLALPGVARDPDGGAMRLQGVLRMLPDGGLFLRSGVLDQGENRLDLALDLLAGPDRPMLRGTISTVGIALPQVVPDAPHLGPDGWSRAPLDVSGLFALDADLTIRAGALRLGDLGLSEIDLRATLERGRLVLDIAGLRAFGGQVAGQFVVNGRGGLSSGGDLILANVELAALPGLEGASGRGSAGIEFLAVGQDLRSLVAGLEAEGDLSLGAGRLPPLDGALSGALSGAGLPETGHDRITADFEVRDGVLDSRDLTVLAPWGLATGEGRIDLAARSLDFRLTPEGGVPILIRGPWSAPDIGPDPEAVAARAEAARIAEAVRARLAATEIPAPPDGAETADPEVPQGTIDAEGEDE